MKMMFSSHPRSKNWDYSKNELKPEEVSIGSRTKRWFMCDECRHSFEKTPDAINSRNGWCPYCANQKLCECETCFKKSFASNPKSKCWDYSKNKLKPSEVFLKSDKNQWFICDICDHNFMSKPHNISGNGSWCPYCANQKLCRIPCGTCLDKSFATHERSDSWDYDKNTEYPEQVFRGSHKKYWFICICGHSFESIIKDIVIDGVWCPYCSVPTRKLCEDLGCSHCLERSFASSEKAQYWNYKRNKIAPRFVIFGTNHRYWFICENSHHFQMSPVCIKINNWCPICVNKTEKKLHENFTLYNLQSQVRFDWCRGEESNKFLPFDFLVEEHKIIIELDGRQHFEQVRNWKSPEEQQISDKRKMYLANKNGYSIIRILQEDVYHDRIDWINEIALAIKLLIDGKIVKNIFIGGDIYNNHREIIGNVEIVDEKENITNVEIIDEKENTDNTEIINETECEYKMIYINGKAYIDDLDFYE